MWCRRGKPSEEVVERVSSDETNLPIMGKVLSRRHILLGFTRIAGFGGVAASVLPLGGCLYERASYRQKVVLEVMTPSGARRGETVMEIGVSFTRKSMEWLIVPDARGGGRGIRRGEALVVELGGGKYLFMTLKGAADLAYVALKRRGTPFRTPFEIRETLRMMRKGLVPRRLSLQLDDLPLLVTFENINDPKTVKRVDPRNLAATFGPGYRLKAAWVEVTDEPVTMGKVERVLPWVTKLVGSIGKDMGLPYDHILNQITDGSFYRR